MVQNYTTPLKSRVFPKEITQFRVDIQLEGFVKFGVNR